LSAYNQVLAFWSYQHYSDYSTPIAILAC